MLLTASSVLRRVFIAVAFLLTSISAQAAGLQPFDAKAFQAAQASGRPILVEIYADWCPTCKAQAPVLDKVSSAPGLSNLARFRVDFDTQKSVVKGFGARYQSTLVLFKGKTELARSIGETSEDKIRAMLSKAI
jgi:thiol-disulfide isomerase/thioredoxin